MHADDIPVEEHKEHHHKTHHRQGSQISRFLLLAIPFLVILTLLTVAVSLYKKDDLGEQYPAETVQPTGKVPKITFSQTEYNKIAPTNPNIIRAYANSSKTTALVSGQPYSYPNPYFEWSGAQVRESGVKITGYYVYLEDGSGVKPRLSVTASSFSPADYGISLESGQTYTLYIQTLTDSINAPLGLDVASNTFALPIFRYVYE